MRWVGLHARARQLPEALLALAAVAALSWVAGAWLAGDPRYGPAARVPVVVAGSLLASVLLGPGLAGADTILERSTPFPWVPARLAHALLGATVGGTAIAVVLLRDPTVFGAEAALRDTLGLTGLVLLAAVALGSGLAWAPVFGYVSVVYLAAPRTAAGPAALWAWYLQPSTSAVAALTAAALCALGAAAYSRYGPADSLG